MSALDYEDTVQAITEGVRRALESDDEKPPAAPMPLKEFAAVDEDGRDLRVVAVVWHEDMMQLVCIVSDPDDGDAIYPVILPTVYPVGTPPKPVDNTPDDPPPRRGITGIVGFEIPATLNALVESNRRRNTA